MSERTPESELSAPADPSRSVAPPTVPAAGGRFPWGLAVVGLLVAAALSFWIWQMQQRTERLERDLARRIQALELRDQQREEQSRVSQDLLRDAQARIALLDSKVTESAGQQAQLRLLYDEMARSRGDLVFSDVETSVMLARQQLRVTGNVAGAVIALQDADQALARSQLPAALGLRRVIGQDIERLQALAVLDLTTALSRLDSLIAGVDRLPLLADVSARAGRPTGASTGPVAGPATEPATEPGRATVAPGAAEPAPEGAAGPASESLTDRMLRASVRTWESALAELARLVRVQRVDEAGVLLLAPDQRYFVRENLRLMLFNVRSHALARNDALLQADLLRVLELIERFFDRRAPEVVAAVNVLGQLQGLRVGADLPTLADTIAAVRAERAASEAVRR